MTTPAPTQPAALADVRAQFPALGRRVGDLPVVFADNASTALKPQCVIDAVHHYYTHVSANVHRGVSLLAQEADASYEEARRSVARLIGARPAEVVFVRNTTEALNLTAHLLALTPADEVVCTVGDHHSNMLPWRARATLRTVPVDAAGRVAPADVAAALTPRTKLLALTHASNVSGIVAPVADLVALAKARGILTVVDAAQSIAHLPVDVRALGCDFLAFSGHKMFGPSGIGVLYGRRDLLEAAPPMLFGGGMVTRVTLTDLELDRVPHRFEAGTPNIEGALGLGAAAEFLLRLGMPAVREHGRELADVLLRELRDIPGLRLHPPPSDAERLPTASFTVAGVSGDDVGGMLSNRYAIMVRSGAHCAEPLLRHLGEQSLVRVSLALYNTLDEVRYVAESVRTVCRFFAAG
jgi:cysteine desulfurase/selenocysteine lyase